MKPEIKTETECARFGGKGKSWKVHAADQGQSLQARRARPCGTVGGPVVKVVGTRDPKTNTITVERWKVSPSGAARRNQMSAHVARAGTKLLAGLKCDH